MLKNHPKTRRVLIWLLCIVIGFSIYHLVDAALFGIDAGRRLPEPTQILQIEVRNIDPEQSANEAETFTDLSDFTVVCNLLGALCDYQLFCTQVEDIPRLSVTMSLRDGGAYTVVVGDRSVSFDGHFEELYNKDAATLLTQLLLD